MTVAEWDRVYRGRQWGRWPNTRFVEWAMRRFGDAPQQWRQNIHFLELGCGAGAQLRFLSNEGFASYGVDGSAAALSQARTNLADLSNYGPVLFESDLLQFEMPTIFPDFGRGPVGAADLAVSSTSGQMDAVLDICTLQHLGTKAADVIVKARRWLRPGGYIFSIFAADGSDKGGFGSDVPPPRLLMASEIPHLFAGFDLKVGMETVRPVDGGTRQHWIIEGRKRS